MTRGTSARRWRLALGRYAQNALGGVSGKDANMDRSLDYLYGREYEKRGLTRSKPDTGRAGTLDPTQMTAITWLNAARDVFPKSVFDTLQDHALSKYDLTELLNDPAVLENLEPNQELLKTLLSIHGRADPALKDKLRVIARKVIDDIMARLKPRVEQAFSGRRNRFARSNIPAAANFDWRATLRENLRRYDPDTGRILAERLRFNARTRRKLPWRVVLCVDQSGSMTDSLIHSAVMAAILSGLPGVQVKMVLFDTSVLDVSDRLTDPIDTLLSVQLGGGTNIGRAVTYAETLIEDPTRTVFALVSDFAEGTSPRPLYAALARMHETRVHMIGLTALSDAGTPYFDEPIAAHCAALGMQVGVMTPDRFAEWLAEIMQ